MYDNARSESGRSHYLYVGTAWFNAKRCQNARRSNVAFERSKIKCSFFEETFSFELNTRTYVMGILNVTPDSFYDGGKWNSPGAALNHALQMQNDGAI